MSNRFNTVQRGWEEDRKHWSMLRTISMKLPNNVKYYTNYTSTKYHKLTNVRILQKIYRSALQELALSYDRIYKMPIDGQRSPEGERDKGTLA